MISQSKNSRESGTISLKINTELVQKILVGFIQSETNKAAFDKVVLGLSGGIDSSTVAYLASEALGSENVIGIMMPYRTSSKESIEDAQIIVDSTKIKYDIRDITPVIDKYFENFPEASKLRRGNKMARERMSILYDYSAMYNALVIGTSNKTELLLGYGTLYGDMASAINPVGDLYKTQLRYLAEAIGVPEKIIQKSPSADLWSNQTDEDELGFTYAEVDRLLYLMVDLRYSRSELISLGFSRVFVDKIYKMVQNSQYKRKLPVIAKISHRTIDRDFRYARDWGK